MRFGIVAATAAMALFSAVLTGCGAKESSFSGSTVSDKQVVSVGFTEYETLEQTMAQTVRDKLAKDSDLCEPTDYITLTE